MFDWASEYIKLLKEGKTVTFHPKGKSMEPLIMNGQLVKIEPIRHLLKIGDIVLCEVGKQVYLHSIKQIAIAENPLSEKYTDLRAYCIGNNKGKINGWTDIKHIYGIYVKE